MWLVRAGRASVYFEKFIMDKKVYLPWEGYRFDLSQYETLKDFRTIVEKEKNTTNRTSVSNWSAQLFSFVQAMKPGDYVLIPSKGSHKYVLSRIVSDYMYSENDSENLVHSRAIDIIYNDIPKDIFPQGILYSLGTFRTIFNVKQEESILKIIREYSGK